MCSLSVSIVPPKSRISSKLTAENHCIFNFVHFLLKSCCSSLSEICNGRIWGNHTKIRCFQEGRYLLWLLLYVFSYLETVDDERMMKMLLTAHENESVHAWLNLLSNLSYCASPVWGQWPIELQLVFEKFQYFYKMNISKKPKDGEKNVWSTPAERLTADRWGSTWSEQSCWRQMNQQETELQTGSIPAGRELDSPPRLQLKFNARHCSPVTQPNTEYKI